MLIQFQSTLNRAGVAMVIHPQALPQGDILVQLLDIIDELPLSLPANTLLRQGFFKGGAWLPHTKKIKYRYSWKRGT